MVRNFIFFVIFLFFSFNILADEERFDYLEIDNKVESLEQALSEADSLYDKEKIDNYISALKSALKLSQEKKREDYEIKVVFLLAGIYQNAALPALSLELLEKYEKTILKYNNGKYNFLFYRRMGLLYYYGFNQIEKGIDFFQRLLDVSLSLNDFEKISYFLLLS